SVRPARAGRGRVTVGLGWPAAGPVVSRIMRLPAEFAPVPAEMLRNVNPAAPISVLATSRPVPELEARVLTIDVLFWVAVTVPPPVAVKAAVELVLMAMPPVKLIVAPVLPVRLMPVPGSVVVAVRQIVPPGWAL